MQFYVVVSMNGACLFGFGADATFFLPYKEMEALINLSIKEAVWIFEITLNILVIAIR